MMQNPPDDNKDNEPENTTDDVRGPSQRDIDRSWDGYESEQGREGTYGGSIVWKTVIVMVSLVILA